MSEPAPPVDPLRFEFDLGFKSVADRIGGERAERERHSVAMLPFHVGFLDDYFRGILPHDLIEIGAETGAGKTDLVTTIANQNAAEGKRVFVIALEAEMGEIERRTKYGLIARWAFERKYDNAHRLSYVDWYLGRCERLIGGLDAEADEYMRTKLSGLHTFYRGAHFDGANIEKLLTTWQTQADLFVIDHLHYVDIDDDKNENAAYKKLIKLIRNVALACGKPVILVVHLKKGEGGRREPLVPSIDRVHGSSDISKIATSAIMISRAPFTPACWWKAPTFFSIPKWRTGGASRLVALCNYDVRTRTYAEEYTLGRLEDLGSTWTEIEPQHRPPWAHRMIHRGGLTTAPPNPRKGR